MNGPIFVLLCLATSDVGAGATERAFLNRHCIRCHGPEKQEADLRLDDLATTATFDAARWSTVAEQLRDGLMPPEGEP